MNILDVTPINYQCPHLEYELDHKLYQYSNINSVIEDISSFNESVTTLEIYFDKIKINNSVNFIDTSIEIFSMIFKKLSVLNHFTPYPPSLIDSIKNYVTMVLNHHDEAEKDRFSSVILDCLIQYPFSQSDAILIVILENIIDKHKEVLSDLIYTKISGGIILPLQALQYIHDQFENSCKKKYGNFNYQALDSFQEFHDAIEKLKISIGDIQISFVVRHHESAHVTPVFVEKCDDCYKFFISDSLGYSPDKEGKIPRFTGEMIKNIFQFMSGQNFIIYASKKQRQRDHTNCTVFSLIDTKKIFSIENLFENLSECSIQEMFNAGSDLVPSLIPIFWIEDLPFKLGLMSQSIKEITDLVNVAGLSEQEMHFRERKIETIRKKYIWYSIERDSSDYRKKIAQNYYIVCKRNKLVKMIIDRVFNR